MAIDDFNFFHKKKMTSINCLWFLCHVENPQSGYVKKKIISYKNLWIRICGLSLITNAKYLFHSVEFAVINYFQLEVYDTFNC